MISVLRLTSSLRKLQPTVRGRNNLDRSMISVICTRLAENGWITRRRTAADARAYTMAVTAKVGTVLASAGVVAGPSMAQRQQFNTAYCGDRSMPTGSP